MPEELTPLIRPKTHDAPSVFQPESLLREARRQKGLGVQPVPTVCVLDPGGDLVRRAHADGTATARAVIAATVQAVDDAGAT